MRRGTASVGLPATAQDREGSGDKGGVTGGPQPGERWGGAGVVVVGRPAGMNKVEAPGAEEPKAGGDDAELAAMAPGKRISGKGEAGGSTEPLVDGGVAIKEGGGLAAGSVGPGEKFRRKVTTGVGIKQPLGDKKAAGRGGERTAAVARPLGASSGEVFRKAEAGIGAGPQECDWVSEKVGEVPTAIEAHREKGGKAKPKGVGEGSRKGEEPPDDEPQGPKVPTKGSTKGGRAGGEGGGGRERGKRASDPGPLPPVPPVEKKRGRARSRSTLASR